MELEGENKYDKMKDVEAEENRKYMREMRADFSDTDNNIFDAINRIPVESLVAEIMPEARYD